MKLLIPIHYRVSIYIDAVAFRDEIICLYVQEWGRDQIENKSHALSVQKKHENSRKLKFPVFITFPIQKQSPGGLL